MLRGSTFCVLPLLFLGLAASTAVQVAERDLGFVLVRLAPLGGYPLSAELFAPRDSGQHQLETCKKSF